MKQKAFTLYETLIVFIVIGIISAILLTAMRPGNIRKDALQKAGKDMYIQDEYATMKVVTANTKNGRLNEIINGANVFSIATASNQSTLADTIFKKHIKGLRSSSLPSSYTNTALSDEAGTIPDNSLKVSSFSGFQAKNDSYFGVKLHGNCTTDETYLYHPVVPSKKTQGNSCGQVFLDVNGPDLPNKLGIDQYIVSLTLDGIR